MANWYPTVEVLISLIGVKPEDRGLEQRAGANLRDTNAAAGQTRFTRISGASARTKERSEGGETRGAPTLFRKRDGKILQPRTGGELRPAGSFIMQRTRFEARESAVPRPFQDLAKQGCTMTFLGVDQHGNLGATTTAATSRENKIVTAALRLRSPTLNSVQKTGKASSRTETHDSGDI